MDEGFLSSTELLFDQALIQSGTILFSAQSPPPITFPALAVAILMLLSSLLKKDFLYDLIAISAAPFEALYGSGPPRASFSL